MGTVISVEGLGKQYRFGSISHHTLAKDLQRLWARARGKEDPNTPIAEHGTASRGPSEERFWALRDVSFEVRQGEVLGIIGRNGAGKSTLLKIMSRITTPTRGVIRVRGRIASLLEVGTGFHPELSGRENVYLNGAILGMRKAEIARKFDEIVEFAEIERFVETPVKRYSSGMYVRLAFAVAAHLEPEILVVDEVLAVGDAVFQQKCLGKISDVARHGRTVMFVSHSMAAVQNLCSRVVWLHEGVEQMAGDPAVVIEAYGKRCASGRGQPKHLPHGYLYYAPGAAQQRDCAIVGIALLDRRGEPLTHLGTGEYARLRIHFSVKKPIHRGAVEVKISTRRGEPLVAMSTQADRSAPLSFEIGTHQIDCIVPEIPLAAGDYSVSAALSIPMVEYLSAHEDLANLHISGRDQHGSGFLPHSGRCPVVVKHAWDDSLAKPRPSGMMCRLS